MGATTTKTEWKTVVLAGAGALNVVSFKGQPYEVGITVPILQKKKLRLGEVTGTTGTGSQVPGCENNPFHHKRGFTL